MSAKRIQRETGVTYKTAWRTFREIRRLLTNEDLQLERPTAEIDSLDTSALGREEKSVGSLTTGPI